MLTSRVQLLQFSCFCVSVCLYIVNLPQFLSKTRVIWYVGSMYLSLAIVYVLLRKIKQFFLPQNGQKRPLYIHCKKKNLQYFLEYTAMLSNEKKPHMSCEVRAKAFPRLQSQVYIFETLSPYQSRCVPKVYLTQNAMARFRFNFAWQMRYFYVQGLTCFTVNNNSHCIGHMLALQ